MPSSHHPPVVDLTGDDRAVSSSPSTTLNPALGGGEEVRLCNPCVPDPNPNPPGYSTVRGHSHRSTHSLSSTMANVYRASSGPNQNREARQERRTVGANDRPQFLNELNSQPHQVPSTTGLTRPRRSFSSREGNLPRGPAPDEGDFCPVCRRQFPPLSPEQPLEARQAHTRACIESYLRPAAPPRTSSAQQGPPLPHPPPAARMLPFVATEKDCLGEHGQAAECTICMEDYEVGQTLARLECLCKFHKHCIVDWFERKMECPVHKLS
ncbi:Zinc finger RING-type [Penicillium robsamsonii]|uniref:Zinc finger RING-type n=1 Tax=Penicillium robsamsonii TaxID=1792511 RepID=UPI0025477A2F|nr:Zinc finger RING-type [Penicillium robsamsonii]KAJ5807647.1 Zinc finger RING-type [Penicillium robsamsonii]